MDFATTMIPGPDPYSEDELRQLQGLVADAARAEELFSQEELEDATRKQGV